jgi:hypothetical protein
MKKQSAAALLSITALFVLNSMTPQSLWMAGKDHHQSTGRFPANQSKTLLEKYNEDTKGRLAKIPNKIPESEKGKTIMDYYNDAVKPEKYLKPRSLIVINKSEEKIEVKADAKPEDLQGLACKQENAETDLELKVKKLVAENEAILKELSELKDAKKKKKEKNKDKKLSLDVPVAPATNHDVFNMMSQISSLMLDQQKQQQDLMNNMFSMMSQNFSFQRAPDMSLPQQGMQGMPMQYLSTDYLLANANIGMSIPGAQGVAPMVSPYLPVQAQIQTPAVNHPMQPPFQQSQVPYQHAGFDFGYSASLGHMASPEFTRIQF